MNAFNTNWVLGAMVAGFAAMACGCAHVDGTTAKLPAESRPALQELKEKYAPDSRQAIFNVGIEHHGHELVLTGEVDRAEARVEAVRALEQTGAKVTDRIKVLPDESLGDEVWGIGCLSVASGRLGPEHKAELGTQILMGEVVRVWKRSSSRAYSWYWTQSASGYLSWLQRGTFVRCTREQADAWNNSPLLIVTAMEDCILERPQAGTQPVSDVVICNVVRKIGEDGDWYKVELPDQRVGFLPKRSAQDYAVWKQARQPTADNIERTARSLLGRPYLWGAKSPKGLDCSGFTSLVFCLNGIDLLRDSSQQARQGTPVPLDPELSQVQKGDLLFFGRRSRGGGPARVVHVGIYLGDKLFIHSSERVRISSLDPDSPIRDENRIRSLLQVRRVLPQS